MELTYELRASTTPLLFTLHVHWPEPLSPKLYMGVWNLFQIWAHKNGSVPQGSPIHAPYSMSIALATKRRLGVPRNDHPMT